MEESEEAREADLQMEEDVGEETADKMEDAGDSGE